MKKTNTIKIINIKKIMDILKDGTNIDSDIEEAKRLVKDFRFNNRKSVIDGLKTKRDSYDYGYGCGADFVLDMLKERINKIAEEILK